MKRSKKLKSTRRNQPFHSLRKASRLAFESLEERLCLTINQNVPLGGVLDINPVSTIFPAGDYARMEVEITTVPGVSYGTMARVIGLETDVWGAGGANPFGPKAAPSFTQNRVSSGNSFRYTNNGTGLGFTETIPVVFKNTTGFNTFTDTIVIHIVSPVGAPEIVTQPTPLQTVGPGQTVTLSVAATGNAPLNYQWFEGVVGATGNPISGATSSTFTTPPLTVIGTQYMYWVRVSNSVGSVNSLGATINVSNPPTANAGGPYTVPEGGSVVLNGLQSSDPDSSFLAYYWDFDGNNLFGQIGTAFGDERGGQPTFNASGLEGPGTYTVHLYVADQTDLQSATTSAIINIVNSPPTATFTTNGTGGVLSFTNVIDSAGDLAAGFMYSYDFNGDGVYDVVDSLSASLAVPANFLDSYLAGGAVRGRIKDRDGGFRDYAASVYGRAILVTSLADENNSTASYEVTAGTSLREAMALAQSQGDADSIVFDTSLFSGGAGTITLSQGTFTISTPVTVSGPTGNNGLALAGLGASTNLRAFNVSTSGNLTLENLTLRDFAALGEHGQNGAANGGGGGGQAGRGGAIFNDGQLTLRRSTLTANTAQGGHGGASGNANTYLYEGETYSFGGGAGFGGGGARGGGAPDFPADGNAGDIYNGGGGGSGYVRISPNFLGAVTVASGNGGAGGFGGGGGGGGGGYLTNAGGTGGVGGTFGGNAGSAGDSRGGGGGGGAGFGGAIFNNGGTVTIENSTFAGNQAVGGAGGLATFAGSAGMGVGGAIFSRGGSVNTTNTTITANSANDARGLYLLSDGALTASATINNSILGQADSSVTDFHTGSINGGAAPLSGGTNNLIHVSLGFNGVAIGGDPQLGALGNYGGPTPTVPLAVTSPAVNALPPSTAIDQRLIARPQGWRNDLGAFEFNSFIESLVVTTTVDEDNGSSDARIGTGTSLREALHYAELHPGADTITFAPSLVGQTITVVSGANGPSDDTALRIAGDVTIDGGAGVTINLASPTPRRTFLSGGGTFAVKNLTLSGGDIRNVNDGGAIWTNGTLIVDKVRFTNNKANNGGAIQSYGTVTVTNSTFDNNAVLDAGGAISTAGNPLSITGSTFQNNAAFNGGAINSANALVVDQSSFSGNQASFNGAALRLFGTSTISNSTIANNTATNGGGGLISHGNTTLTNVTLAGNQALDGGGAQFFEGSATLRHVTVAGNTANRSGGGTVANSADVTLANTIVSGNAGPDQANVWGTLNAASAGNILNLSAAQIALGALANNGGPTQTRALLPGSPAFDAGIFVGGISTDQRGTPRDTRPDVGAFEFIDFAPQLQVTTTSDEDNKTADPRFGSGTSLREAIRYAQADFSTTGFGVNGSGWTFNGSTPNIAAGAVASLNDVLTITPATGGTNSAWLNRKVNVNRFTASFRYTQNAGTNGADGFTLTFQNAGLNALGGGGGSLGYAGIAQSVGFGFNIYGGVPTGFALFSNGNTTGGVYTPIGNGVSLTNGQPVDITISANGADVTLTLTQGANTFTNTFTNLNIAGIVGASTAYVGFTGATGGAVALQQISRFSFTSAPTDTVVTFAPALGGQNVVLSSAWSQANDAERTSALVIDRNVTVQGLATSPGITLQASSTGSLRHFFVTSTGALTLEQVTLTGGTAGLAGSNFGGAVWSFGSLIVRNSTFTGNSTTGEGGAIQSWAGAPILQVESSTIAGNSSGNIASAVSTGAVSNLFDHVTIVDNSAPSANGTLWVYQTTLDMRHSIVARNTNDGIQVFGNGTFASASAHNIVGIGSWTGLNPATNQLNIASSALRLGTLADDGGPTKTIALLPGSVAIDAGNAASVAGVDGVPQFDQRGDGFARVVGNAIDVGAFELQTAPLAGDYNRNSQVDAADYVLWRKRLGQSGITRYSGADGDGSGNVNQSDYDVWRAHFGEVVPLATGSAQLVVATNTSMAIQNTSQSLASDNSDVVAAATLGQGNERVAPSAIPNQSQDEFTSPPATDMTARDAFFGELESQPHRHFMTSKSLASNDRDRPHARAQDALALLLSIDRLQDTDRESVSPTDCGQTTNGYQDELFDSGSNISTKRQVSTVANRISAGVKGAHRSQDS